LTPRKPAASIIWLPSPNGLVKPDEWFAMDAIANGPKIEIHLDGRKVADYTDLKKNRLTGYIALQHSIPQTKFHFPGIEIK
jgi:hypothetical protein